MSARFYLETKYWSKLIEIIKKASVIVQKPKLISIFTVHSQQNELVACCSQHERPTGP